MKNTVENVGSVKRKMMGKMRKLRRNNDKILRTILRNLDKTSSKAARKYLNKSDGGLAVSRKNVVKKRSEKVYDRGYDKSWDRMTWVMINV